MNKLNRINEDPAFLNLIDYEKDSIMRVNTLKNIARKEGMEQGIELGKEQGIELGKEQGERIGIIKTAQNMKRLNVPMNIIMETTGLTRKELDGIN